MFWSELGCTKFVVTKFSNEDKAFTDTEKRYLGMLGGGQCCDLIDVNLVARNHMAFMALWSSALAGIISINFRSSMARAELFVLNSSTTIYFGLKGQSLSRRFFYRTQNVPYPLHSFVMLSAYR